MRHESKMHTYLYVVSGQKVAQLKFRGLAFVDLIELEGAMTPNSEKKRSTSTAVAFRDLACSHSVHAQRCTGASCSIHCQSGLSYPQSETIIPTARTLNAKLPLHPCTAQTRNHGTEAESRNSEMPNTPEYRLPWDPKTYRFKVSTL